MVKQDTPLVKGNNEVQALMPELELTMSTQEFLNFSRQLRDSRIRQIEARMKSNEDAVVVESLEREIIRIGNEFRDVEARVRNKQTQTWIINGYEHNHA